MEVMPSVERQKGLTINIQLDLCASELTLCTRWESLVIKTYGWTGLTIRSSRIQLDPYAAHLTHLMQVTMIPFSYCHTSRCLCSFTGAGILNRDKAAIIGWVSILGVQPSLCNMSP